LDYQIIAENIMGKKDNGSQLTREKHRAILKTDCPIVFSRYEIPFVTAKTCRIKIEHLEQDSIGSFFRRDHLFGTKKIPMVAVSLALYMGFSLIGIIGHDLTGKRYIEDSPVDTLGIQKHHVDNENRYAAIVNRYAERNRTYIYNLSTVSLITSFPSVTPREFRKKVLQHGTGKQI
jgi:hypothetical protein